MALYELKNAEGKVVERVRPVPESENERQLAAKAAAEGSSWSVVDEDKTGEEAAPGAEKPAKVETRPPKGPNSASGAESTTGGEGK